MKGENHTGLTADIYYHPERNQRPYFLPVAGGWSMQDQNLKIAIPQSSLERCDSSDHCIPCDRSAFNLHVQWYPSGC